MENSPSPQLALSSEHIESVGGSLSVGQNTVRKCSFPSPISNGAPSTSALLSDDVEQYLQTFLEAIDQHRLASPISNQDKKKIMTWLLNTTGNLLDFSSVGIDNQPQYSQKKDESDFRYQLFSYFLLIKIRRKSDPAALIWRSANAATTVNHDPAEPLLRKWSTKSNCSGRGGVDHSQRTLREQMIFDKSVGNVAIKGRGSSSSFSGSRPLIPFPVNHSDSAIGSSLDGSFSCSFLPPPPPYRPPCSLIESGSDGILGSQQHNKTPQGKDFTSLLGFDTLILPSAINRSSPTPSAMSSSELPDQERIQRLIASRDNLSMKVAKLTKQVTLQREKIHEMETMLNARSNDEVKNNRNNNEVVEPIAQELANLQHNNLTLEREKFDAERRLRLSNSELEHYITGQPPLSKSRLKIGDVSSVARTEFEKLQLAIQRLLEDNEQKQQQKNFHQQSFPAFLPMSNSFTFALGTQHQQMTSYTPPLWRVSSPPSIPPHLSHSPRPSASPMARRLAAELDELRRSGVICTTAHPSYSSASLPRSIHSKSNSLGSCAPKLIYQHQPNIYGGGLSSRSDDETAFRFSASANNSQQNGSKSFHNKKEKRGRRPRSTLRSFLGRFAHRGNSLQDLRTSPRFPSPISFLTKNAGTTVDSTGFSNPPISEFVEWDSQKCNLWLHECGFDGYSMDAVHSGRHLINLTDKDFERDLGIKSGLQRKRLKCLLTRIERRVGTDEIEAPDRFDTNQVMIWLDLIGLPQYRDLFANYRMDGRLLLELSAQDLLELGIHSALNHASLARAIQFLRSAEFHLHRMEGHFDTDSLCRSPIPTEVERWSHHCTLGWLCSIDLAEFTQNLAFSGIHGALLVLEPTFTAESLAELLQIPMQKTLLRRHLSTQFNTLLGQKVINHKRDVTAQPFVTHLTPFLRIKLAKKSVGVGFSLSRKKSKSDLFVEPEVRVCPAEINGTAVEAITNV
ncbi:SAM domain-containing protein [Meloidogyne graminicola]|uniref:SAM domain-containing protein n=1 Tax=Meloidogyne graminicola TaxID=189291 RepID=A0A8S9ZHN4_9BILA|nr:SAM domain-containing protein [Meloidogyne graminicola]